MKSFVVAVLALTTLASPAVADGFQPEDTLIIDTGDASSTVTGNEEGVFVSIELGTDNWSQSFVGFSLRPTADLDFLPQAALSFGPGASYLELWFQVLDYTVNPGIGTFVYRSRQYTYSPAADGGTALLGDGTHSGSGTGGPYDATGGLLLADHQYRVEITMQLAASSGQVVTGSGWVQLGAVPVPEPGTVLMFGVGAAMLALRGRRTRPTSFGDRRVNR